MPSFSSPPRSPSPPRGRQYPRSSNWRSDEPQRHQNPTNGRGVDHARIQRPVGQRYHAAANHLREPRNPPPLILRQNANHSSWSEVTIIVDGINPISLNGVQIQTGTLDLYRTFKDFGRIVWIEIYELRSGDRRAKIRFSPPPKDAFWEKLDNLGTFEIRLDRHTVCYNARIKLDDRKPRGPEVVQSPTQKSKMYPVKMMLAPASLDFGVIMEQPKFMPMKTIKSIGGYPLNFEVDLKKKKLKATFWVHITDPKNLDTTLDRYNQFFFEIPFTDLKTIHEYRQEDTFSFVIILKSPPLFFRKRAKEEDCHSDETLSWSEFDTWYRQTDVVYNPPSLLRIKVALPKHDHVIDIGRWTTYRFTFRDTDNDKGTYTTLKNALLDFNIEIVEINDLELLPPRPAEIWQLIDPPLEASGQDLGGLDDSELWVQLPFEVRYQLEVCMSHEVLNQYSLTKDFVEKLASMTAADPSSARSLLEYVANQDKRIWDPMTIFDDRDALDFSTKTDIPHYCAYARKATVTPTTIYYSTPTVEITNRVLRKFARENLDGRFLRVQFTDELQEGRINHSANKSQKDELFSRVYRTLYNGIQIGDRHYEFLAFGNSQFRENGAYFFCPTSYLTSDDIRNWMGNFSHIKVVAKYAARLGQCFSTTRAIHGLAAPEIKLIPDIERKDGDAEYCFTDGVGKISLFLAQMITNELKLNVPYPPSAFQFRLGGCKGILAVSPDAKDREVHIRKSQEKFKAVYNGLEIIRWSRFSSATLNRQTITILSSLGVPDEVFIDLLTEQLQSYHLAMSDHALAQNLLTKFIDDNQMTINIAAMINNGFMTEDEPFVLSLLQLWRAWSVKLLKEKAKIIVEQGAFLLGCVDETNTLKGHVNSKLEPGEFISADELPEIFVQIPQNGDTTKYGVLEGVCIVGRNPSLHPGDLRVVKAVDVPALHHLRDVVVFSQQGDRDVPSMCSGGDLDGDDFFVIWDTNLIPQEWDIPAMNYQAPQPKALSDPVRVIDLMKFFVRFMKNDSLPTIAHAHLGHSDLQSDGVKGNTCLELASLHSKAVDYVKTGQPAEMPKRLKVPMWPHFMEKRYLPKDKIYPSYKILGKLYDKVESVAFEPKYKEPFDKRILRAYTLEDELLTKARRLKTQYDNAMRRVMAQQEISTEFEVWSTFVLSKPRVGTDYKQQEEMAFISNALKDRFRLACIEQAGSKDFSILGPFVACMYKVTKEEMDIALAECRRTRIIGGREVPYRRMEPKFMPLMSFPWLFEKELGRIATGIDPSEELDVLPSLSQAGEMVAQPKHAVGGGDLLDMEDFITFEDGNVIHRGEELDLFGPDADDEADETDSDEEVRSRQDYRDGHEMMMGESGEVVFADRFLPTTSIPEHLMSGTGIEEVVPFHELDGLVFEPRENTAESPNAGITHPVDPSEQGLSDTFEKLTTRDDDVSSSSPFEFSTEEEQVYAKVKESQLERFSRMVKLDNPPTQSDISNGAFEHDAQVSKKEAEHKAEEQSEEEVQAKVKESQLDRIARMLGMGHSQMKAGGNGKSAEEQPEEPNEEKSEEESEEEQVAVVIKESAAEKIARLMG